MLQGNTHLTEINEAEFVLHTEPCGISREANMGALAWERLLDLKDIRHLFLLKQQLHTV